MATGTRAAPSADDTAVAKVLDGLRVEQAMTQADLARAVAISQPQVSRMLAGRKPITMTELRMMCEALGVRMSDVLRDAGL